MSSQIAVLHYAEGQAARVKEALDSLDGVESFEFNYPTRAVKVTFSSELELGVLIKAIRSSMD